VLSASAAAVLFHYFVEKRLGAGGREKTRGARQANRRRRTAAFLCARQK